MPEGNSPTSNDLLNTYKTSVFDQTSNHKCNFHDSVMSMMASQILNLWISQKQKSRYLENETNFIQKKNLLQIKGYLMAKNSFIAEVKI